jgi:hypothetical protein
MNVEDLAEQIREQNRVAHQVIDAFIAADTSLEFARVLIVNKLKCTYGHAADLLQAYESITGKQLRR